MRRRSFLHATAATAASSLIAAPAFVRAAGSLQKFKFNLGWKVEASGAGFLLAQQRGYYKDAGLDVVIDTGNGSASAISLVAGGAYDCASADLAAMLEFNAANPAAALKAVAIHNRLRAPRAAGHAPCWGRFRRRWGLTGPLRPIFAHKSCIQGWHTTCNRNARERHPRKTLRRHCPAHHRGHARAKAAAGLAPGRAGTGRAVRRQPHAGA